MPKNQSLDLEAARRAFARLDAAVVTERRRLAETAEGAGRRRETALLVLDEIEGSCALTSAILDRDELRALIDRGIAAGARPLRTYLVAAGYADAARWAAKARTPRRGEPYLWLEEIVDLHARALRLQPELRPGEWRRTTLPAFRAGVVPPPFWLVPRETAHYVERLAPGPGADSPLLWVARALEQFDRIRPFAAGNARAGRLVANLLLRRLGLPPFRVRRRDAARYLQSLAQADVGDPWPLAVLVARSVLGGLQRLVGASEPDAGVPLVALANLATGREREALYKAAQRGRLRVVRRDRALMTTREWLDAYRSSRTRMR